MPIIHKPCSTRSCWNVLLIIFASLLGVIPASRADLSGFANCWVNGGATISNTAYGSTLTLTDGGTNEARSAFFTRQEITRFRASFVYRASNFGGLGAADGMAFIFQNDGRGLSALGPDGGSLGYAGITPSAALELNLYFSDVKGSANVVTNGATGSYYSTSPVDLRSGHPILVALSYDNPTMVVDLTDQTTNQHYRRTVPIDLPGLLGGTAAYVGFSGATGGGTSTQQVSNFQFESLINSASYTVTPRAGANGSVTPDSPQTVNSGGSISFTATPDSGYSVKQWLVNGSVAQTGGPTFALDNVTADQTVDV